VEAVRVCVAEDVDARRELEDGRDREPDAAQVLGAEDVADHARSVRIVCRMPAGLNGGVEGERGSARQGSEDNVEQTGHFSANSTLTALSEANVEFAGNRASRSTLSSPRCRIRSVLPLNAAGLPRNNPRYRHRFGTTRITSRAAPTTTMVGAWP